MIREYIAYIKDNPKKYWFRARLYGWGWVPATHEGWLVTLIYGAVVSLPLVFFAEQIDGNTVYSEWYMTAVLVATCIFLFTCYKKGERPHWQWGPPKKYSKKK